MMNRLKLSLRLVPLAVIFALALAFATTNLASAAPVKSAPASPLTSCLSVTPTYQAVALGQPANLTIEAMCALPPQPVVNASVVVAWGDGSSNTYVYCLEVCHLSISASHTYMKLGDYHPSICLTVPTPVAETIACTSVEIQVFLPPAS